MVEYTSKLEKGKKMTPIKDYAKKPVRTADIISAKDVVAGALAIAMMGSVLGLIMGYGLLYTGV